LNLIFSILRLFSPELAHTISLNSLKIIHRLGLIGFLASKNNPDDFHSFNNLVFKNRLGIAAGLDKNGDFIDSLGALGFGFIEVGTITPLSTGRKSKAKNI
jgi:dihydroorotate dehydrogenase